MDDNLVQIILSVLGAESVTGAFSSIDEQTNELAGSLVRLTGVALSLDAAMEGIRGAVELGASLEHLSARTGQTVEDLVVLQRAFQSAGLSGDEVGMMASRLQKALGGINELGQNTSAAWAALKIDPSQMMNLSFEDQLKRLQAAFAGLNSQAERTQVSMDLFGLHGAAMLQILTQGDVLKQAGEDAGRLAERMQADAASFDAAATKLSLIKVRMQELWAAAAEQLLPTLTKIAGLISGMNFGAIGAGIGSAAAIAIPAFVTSALVSKMDDIVTTTTLKMGEGVAQNVGFALSGFTGFLAKILPIGLAAAVAAAVVTGIVSAWQDAAVQKIRHSENATKTVLAAGNSIQSDPDRQKALDAAKEQLKNLTDAWNAERAKWVPNDDLLASYVAQIGQVRQKIDELSDGGWSKVTEEQNLSNAAMEKTKKNADDLLRQMDSLQQKHQQLREQQMEPGERLEMYQGQLEDLQSKKAAPRPAYLNADQNKAIDLDYDNQILEVQANIKKATDETNAIEKQITENYQRRLRAAEQLQQFTLETQLAQSKANGDEAGAERLQEQLHLLEYQQQLHELGVEDVKVINDRVAAEDQLYQKQVARRAAEKADLAEKNAMEQGISALNEQRSKVQYDPTLTESEKWAKEKAILNEEIALRQKYVDTLNAERTAATAAGDKTTAAVKETSITPALKGLDQSRSGVDRLGPDPNDWSAQWTVAMTKLRSQWQTTAATITQSMTAALNGIRNSLQNSIGNSLANVIQRTESWKQAASDVGRSFETSVIQAFTNMVAQYAVSKAGMFALDTLFAAKSLALSLASAAKSLLGWLPSAIAASISSYGMAAVIGGAAVIAAIAAFKGFSDGGYTGGGAADSIAGVVHGGEFVFSAPAVRNLGAANLEAAHRAAVSGDMGGLSTAFSTAASNGGGGSSSGRPERHVAYVDTKEQMKRMMREPWYENHHVNLMKRRRGEVYST